MLYAKSVRGIQQEFIAYLIFPTMAQLLMANSATELEIEHPDLSAKAGILTLADGIVRLMLCDVPEQRLKHHADLLRRIARRRLKRRPGRSFPRRSFKPGPRWNSKGKVG